MDVLYYLLEAILNPYTLIFLIFFLTVAWFFWGNNPYMVRSGLVITLIGLLLFSTGWIPQLLTNTLENQYPIIMKPNPAVRWVVVFSGGQATQDNLPANGLLNGASIKRLIEGVRLYRQLPQSNLLLSGGGYGGSVAEATNLAILASWFSIPTQAIQLEKSSINTGDQAKAIKQWLHDEPFYLVTSAIHMPRAMALCQKQGLHPIAAPTDFTHYWHDERWEKSYLPNANNLVYSSIAFHELFGRLRDIVARITLR